MENESDPPLKVYTSDEDDLSESLLYLWLSFDKTFEWITRSKTSTEAWMKTLSGQCCVRMSLATRFHRAGPLHDHCGQPLACSLETLLCGVCIVTNLFCRRLMNIRTMLSGAPLLMRLLIIAWCCKLSIATLTSLDSTSTCLLSLFASAILFMRECIAVSTNMHSLNKC
ncbi:hypothetical protein AVEN_24067-1 [Araneus ventricosus]|uniref:Uncharacterized protein n=1 Tax=Araneus ventricosus TaxID=182803 RepID=A0A4Y2NJX2_ARAVE|nr:hypothetical protein AVEN_24067-1 [Araneus ventricosus]